MNLTKQINSMTLSFVPVLLLTRKGVVEYSMRLKIFHEAYYSAAHQEKEAFRPTAAELTGH